MVESLNAWIPENRRERLGANQVSFVNSSMNDERTHIGDFLLSNSAGEVELFCTIDGTTLEERVKIFGEDGQNLDLKI